MSAFRYEKDTDGIVTITMDMDGPVNAINDIYKAAMADTVARLEAEKELTGVIFTSAKKTFVAGGDLHKILATQPGEEEAVFENVEEIKAQFRRLEKLPVPVVAAVNGAALGGGFELCLACNRRIMWGDNSVEIGLPEVGLGLLPGAGGVVRLTNLLGLEAALPYLLEGKKVRGSKAVDVGFMHEAVDTLDELLPRAKAWILESNDEANAIQPWDQKGYKIPGGNIWSPRVQQTVIVAPHMLQSKTRGLLPAPERILETAVEAVTIGFDAALTLESRMLANLVTTPQAKNMITSLFFQLNQVNGGASRPEGVEPQTVKRLGIVGAGMMGQGIAFVAAKAGIPTVLKDVTLEGAEKGKAYSATLMDKAIKRGRSDEAKKAALLDLITPTDKLEDLEGCDLIIEAVFEDMQLKNKVVGETETVLAKNGVWGSNTSTLPITELAKAASNPEKFVGVHFFSPVDKMPLVELIRGEKTEDETLAKAFDFVRQIKKTPIVVKDSLGFFTSRTIGAQLAEAAQMIAEGIDPVRVDNLGYAIGMPVGPLTLYDELSLQLALSVRETQIASGLIDPAEETRLMGWEMLASLVRDHKRAGRHHGNGGFYNYRDGNKEIWPELRDMYLSAEVDSGVADEDIKDRLLFSSVIESLVCLEDGILSNVADGNIGSIMGIGAPPWTGGYIQFVNTYGLDAFIERCDDLAEKYGDRFKAPAIVQQKIDARETFV